MATGAIDYRPHPFNSEEITCKNRQLEAVTKASCSDLNYMFICYYSVSICKRTTCRHLTHHLQRAAFFNGLLESRALLHPLQITLNIGILSGDVFPRCGRQ